MVCVHVCFRACVCACVRAACLFFAAVTLVLDVTQSLGVLDHDHAMFERQPSLNFFVCAAVHKVDFDGLY